jgi:Flp pilus assembly protein TadB
VSVFRGKLLWLVVVGVAAMAVAIYLLASAEQKLRSDTCSGLSTIASDSRKMEYLKADSFADERRGVPAIQPSRARNSAP